MKGFFAGLLGFTIVVVLLAIAYVTQATWLGKARDHVPVFGKMHDVMYEGPADKAPQPAFRVHTGDTVRVLWDLRERGYWLCYVRTGSGLHGWASCNPLQRAPD